MSTFTVVNDETLSNAISQCQQQLIYVAPGISSAVVEAIRVQLDGNPNIVVTLIVDVDPEVYRLGYGTMDGLKALQGLVASYHLELRQQTGIRIGLLVCDGRTLVYSPTPLLIEAGSESEEKPNAIWIGQDTAKEIIQSCDLGGTGEIGQDVASPQKIEASLKSLKDEPPKKFDLARIERVYHSKIQFVELELTGYRLSSKKITIPNDLLVGDDKKLNEKLKNSFQLLGNGSAPRVKVPALDPKTNTLKRDDAGAVVMEEWDEVALEAARKKIYEDFLINVPRYGWVIMCRMLDDFDKRMDVFKTQVEAYKEAVKSDMAKAIDTAIKELTNVLLPRLKENLPSRFRKCMSAEPTDDAIRRFIDQELSRAIGGVGNVFAPGVRCVHKAVTYESIKDGKFMCALQDAMNGAGGMQAELLFSEHDVAREV